MAFYKRRPPCPNCAGVRQQTISGGWANDETLPYLYVRCLTCGYRGIQVTIWLPPEASSTSMDGQRRAYQRRYARIKTGQLPQLRRLIQRRGRRLTDDTVEISARIVPGHVEPGLAKRLAGLKRKRDVA